MLLDSFEYGDNVTVTDTHIQASYDYCTTKVEECKNDNGEKSFKIRNHTDKYEFFTEKNVPKLGLMLVGWGGNNGTTVTAGILANKHKISWETKEGVKQPNYYGSLTQSSVIRVGNFNGQECFVPFNKILPFVSPDDLVLGGWDISSHNMEAAMARAKVLDVDLQKKLKASTNLHKMVPLPGIFDPGFVAANQSQRADNVIAGSKKEQMEKVRNDIREFKKTNNLDKVIVLWTANTERYTALNPDLHRSASTLLRAIDDDQAELSPSTLYATACVLEKTAFINGAPQNTFVPGLVELAREHDVLLGGDDFKSGQTKMKSVLTDFLVGAGIKPTCIVSYNHLGNNDGKNLSAPETFRSKEISKSDVVKDIIENNEILYPKDKETGAQQHPDHCVVIKYVPYVGDSKRALDEYTSEIFLNGLNTIVMHNTCEDSLLAAPLILDLVLIAELTQRITFRSGGESVRGFGVEAVLLSYLTKAPFFPKHHPMVNALGKQRAMLENTLRACVGLPPDSNMFLEFK